MSILQTILTILAFIGGTAVLLIVGAWIGLDGS